MFCQYFKEPVRQHFESIFQEFLASGEPVYKNIDDLLIVKLIKEHPSSLTHWSKNGFDSFEWDETNINPFVHVLMHYVVEKLLKSEPSLNSPVKSFYTLRKRKFMKHHDIAHMLAQVIASNTFCEMRKECNFSKEKFYADLKKYSTWNRTRFWNHFNPEDLKDVT